MAIVRSALALPELMAPFALKLGKSLCEFPPSARYLIGLSGGRDSVALLDALVRQGYRKLVVCHLNHQLRGRASEADARFVQKLADHYQLPVEIGAVDVGALARKKKLSLETAAREARYTFFAGMARRRRCRTIFLGHHADDLVETFLINLFRGTGPAGFISIREQTTRRIDGVSLTILRPLLPVWRREIDLYIKRCKLSFREDASNLDLTPMRNRIRRRVIPYLEKALSRGIRENIWRTAQIVIEEECFFEDLLPAGLSEIEALAIEPLQAMSVAVQRRMLHQWLRGRGIANVGFDLVERVRALLDPAKGVAKTNLPRNRHVRRRAKRIFIEN